MQRLLKISFDIMLSSLTPILLWFLLSIIVDKSLISVFTITYPIQCIYGVLHCIFSTGANICRTRDKNKNAVMSGLVAGSVLSIIIYGYIIINVDSYIEFMNMDVATYRTFTIYSLFILIYQTIFSFIIDKLYYENANSRANKYSLIFNFLNFFVVITTALLTKNPQFIVTTAIIIMGVFTLYVVARNWNRFRFRLNLLHCIKYDSSSLVSNAFAFIGYLFGLSNALEFGPEFGLAITFTALITDTQWDVLDSVCTLAKIEITQKKFNFKKSLQNAYKLVGLIYISIAAMFLSLYWFYELNFTIALIFLSVQLIDFILSPAYYLYTSFLQLNWSASKVTANRIIARAARFYCSLLPTPFCNDIGQLVATFYQVVTTRLFFRRHFIIDKNGYIRKRPTRHRKSPQYQYSDLPIDDSE